MDPINAAKVRRKRGAEKQLNETMPAYDASTLIPQNFALPEATMYYIIKNVSKASVYTKLIQSCKWFYLKNPIIVVKFHFNFRYNFCRQYDNPSKNKKLTWADIKHKPKLWVTDCIIHRENPPIQDIPI
uniref:Uncharacterized protein n=1 Tax=Panagrolaimus superbus TaxID=310955 RepID=A0A914YTY3_9BILA